MNLRIIGLVLLQSILNIGGAALVKVRVTEFKAVTFRDNLSMVLNFKMISGIALIGIGFLATIAIMKDVKLSVYIPLAAAVSFITSSVIGYFFLNEIITPKMMLAYLIIFSGILLLQNRP